MEQATLQQFRLDGRDSCDHASIATMQRISQHSASDVDAAAWDELSARSVDPNPFFERWFLLPSICHLSGSSKPAIVTFGSDARLDGLIPVASRNIYEGYPLPHVAGWRHDHMFSGSPLIRRGCEHAFWTALLRHFDANAGRALFLHLYDIPAEGPSYTALREIVRCQARPAAIVYRGQRAMLRSPLDPETYFAQSMSGKKRKELRRQYNRLSEQGELAFERAEGSENLDAWTEEYLALEQAGWKGEARSALRQTNAARKFFATALKGAAEAGRLERLSLRLDGRAIAMLANFLSPPGAFSFKTTYDENHARYSPGVLLQRENLDLLARAGIEWADSCAAADHPMIERIWREKRTITRISIAIGGRLRRGIGKNILRAETRRRGSGL